MHIPDGLLDPRTFVSLDLVGAGVVALAAARARRALAGRSVPLMAVVAAFIFAAQMLNFPVAAGTSGHFMGAAFAAVVLGPWAAVLSMTLVLVLQALLLGDGGVLALGANVVNMAVIAPGVGYGVFRLMRALGRGPAFRYGGAFAGACLATLAAAAACASELAWARVAPPRVIIPAMLVVHIPIGLVEGIITALALAALRRLRPDLTAAAWGDARP